MNKLFALFFILLSVSSYTQSLKPFDSKWIEDAGIPLFPEAIFANGNQDIGFRFATTVPPEEVREWYGEQLPKWSIYNKYGG